MAAKPHPLCSAALDNRVAGKLTAICGVWDLREKDGPRPLQVLLHVAYWMPDDWQNADFLLLGEVHDNAGHHALQSQVMLRLVEGPLGGRQIRKSALVLEHIRADQQAALDLFADMRRNGQHLGSPATLLRLLKWDESGWPDKAMFEPLFRAAINAGLPILAGDPPRERVRAISRGGLSQLADGDRKRLHLDDPLEPRLQGALLDELEASHCGLVPRSAFGGMALAQRYRDAHLAAALAEALEAHGSAILLAGNGHVRTDRAVPHYLRRLAPGKSIVAVVMAEVEDGKEAPAAYVPRSPDGKAAADYLVLTPRAERADPCEQMRERFGKK